MQREHYHPYWLFNQRTYENVKGFDDIGDAWSELMGTDDKDMAVSDAIMDNVWVLTENRDRVILKK